MTNKDNIKSIYSRIYLIGEDYLYASHVSTDIKEFIEWIRDNINYYGFGITLRIDVEEEKQCQSTTAKDTPKS